MRSDCRHRSKQSWHRWLDSLLQWDVGETGCVMLELLATLERVATISTEGQTDIAFYQPAMAGCQWV
ncbi:MAG: hypothetical protein KDH08_21190, partial [Anaerolineae bacterium]|nr:hypothetical protein [Anaerolineae bacterium]